MLRAVILCLLLACASPSKAEPSGFRPLQDWPMGPCADYPLGKALCFDAPGLWRRYGHGAPEIEVAVVETWATHAMPQVLAQHPWLAHQEIPTFWHVQKDDDLPIVPGQILPSPVAIETRQSHHAVFCAQRPSHPTCEVLTNRAGPRAGAALAYLGWQGLANHELKMIGLIAGQDVASMRRSGLSPLGAVSLHYVETTPSRAGLSQLARRLEKRPGSRVINFSNQGPQDELLDLHYARIYRTALSLNAGLSDQTGDSPAGRLLIASSANTTGTRRVARALPLPSRFVPPEAVVTGASQKHQDVQADARAAHLLHRPDVPLLVVGGISRNGQLFGEARIEPMIDLYAPGGMTEPQIFRARGARSATRRALESYDAIRALQGCKAVAAAAQGGSIATLDWGPNDDIRSAKVSRRAANALEEVMPALGARDLGCDARIVQTEGVFLSRSIGNSVSTALVSAVAAQMFALDPELSAGDAAKILRKTAQANRVHGLPVLAPDDALRTVLSRFVDRYVARSLRLRSAGQAPAAHLRPLTVLGAALPRQSEGTALRVAKGSIRSRAVSPDAFGQTAWLSLRDDPPLVIGFTLQNARPGGGCQTVTLESDIVRSSGRTYRRVRSEKIGPPGPCDKGQDQ